MKKRFLIIFSLILILFISGACASDDFNQENYNGTDTVSISDSDIVLSENVGGDVLSASEESSNTSGVVITAPDVVKYYGGSERLSVLVESDGKPVSNQSVGITINGVTYNRVTNENGTASLALNLIAGDYPVKISYNDNYADCNVSILATLNGTDISKMYKNGTQYYATFRDSEGKYLASGSNVTFNINGVFYTRQVSGDKGLARLNINLIPGEYVLTAYNTENGERTSNVITVISRIVENSDLVKYYKNSSQYVVRVLGDNAKPVGAGETVKFNINGVYYDRVTNSSGHAKININLAPGAYIITAEHKDSIVSNSIKVNQILFANDLNKLYKTADAFKTTLLDGQGKPYANKNVTFNINGVYYDRTTDSNGVAKLNINLHPNKYIITSTFNGLSISNNIEVIPIEISISDIADGAYYLRCYYETHGVLPATLNAPVHTYTLAEFYYLMNKAIEQLGSSNRNNVAIIHGVQGVNSPDNTITSCLIKKDEFVNIAKDIASKISKNKQVPDSVSTSSGVVSYNDYAIIASKIMSFYHDYSYSLADYVTFVSNKVASNFNFGMNSNPFGLTGKNVYIDADGGSDEKKWELARAFAAAGWNVKVGKTHSNAHYEDYFNVPSNYVLITVYNGFCAGTIRELASSYIQNVLRSKNCVCVPVWDSIDWTNPDGMGPYRYGDFSGYSAKRAWDDNFSITDPSISNVAQYLAANNIKYCTYPTTEGIMYQFANGGFSTSMIR